MAWRTSLAAFRKVQPDGDIPLPSPPLHTLPTPPPPPPTPHQPPVTPPTPAPPSPLPVPFPLHNNLLWFLCLITLVCFFHSFLNLRATGKVFVKNAFFVCAPQADVWQKTTNNNNNNKPNKQTNKQKPLISSDILQVFMRRARARARVCVCVCVCVFVCLPAFCNRRLCQSGLTSHLSGLPLSLGFMYCTQALISTISANDYSHDPRDKETIWGGNGKSYTFLHPTWRQITMILGSGLLFSLRRVCRSRRPAYSPCIVRHR